MLRNVLSKYKLIFNGTLVNRKIKPTYIEVQTNIKPYQAKLYSVPRSQEAIYKN